jgi:hypothetical protein
MMRSLDIEDDEALISSVVFYHDKQDEYYALEDMIKKWICLYLLTLILQ